jgi:hypothetical protein
MNETDFINLYIKNLVSEVEELSKSRIVDRAKAQYFEEESKKLKEELEEVQSRLDARLSKAFEDEALVNQEKNKKK